VTDPGARPRNAELDEKLAALRDEYRRSLPEQLAALATLLAAPASPETADAAWRLAHRLKGTSGSYGFRELATRLETIEESFERARRTHTAATDDERSRAAAELERARAMLR
jgi:HPt (histidine-containing phosphotransfer) domain-containing protein